MLVHGGLVGRLVGRLLLLLLLLLMVRGVLGVGRLRTVVVVFLAVAMQIGSHAVSSKLLSGRRATGEGSGGGRLGGGAQTGEQMRPTRSRGGSAIVLGRLLIDGLKRERLDVVAATARGQAGRGHGETVAGLRRKVVGRHLSVTTSVHGSEAYEEKNRTSVIDKCDENAALIKSVKMQ